ncbi:MAG: hypothetical protein AB7F59_08220 [Bdellovibrionales bacterium]
MRLAFLILFFISSFVQAQVSDLCRGLEQGLYNSCPSCKSKGYEVCEKGAPRNVSKANEFILCAQECISGKVESSSGKPQSTKPPTLPAGKTVELVEQTNFSERIKSYNRLICNSCRSFTLGVDQMYKGRAIPNDNALFTKCQEQWSSAVSNSTYSFEICTTGLTAYRSGTDMYRAGTFRSQRYPAVKIEDNLCTTAFKLSDSELRCMRTMQESIVSYPHYYKTPPGEANSVKTPSKKSPQGAQ